MGNTGYRIDVLKDTNLYSPTYNTTKTEKHLDAVTCPNQDPVWVEISRSCQQITYSPSGALGNNGKADITERDNNPNSPTYDQTRVREVNDQTTCPLPNTNPVWTLDSSYCETV